MYFNLDTDLIRYLLEKADGIFREHAECDLDGDVAFFNRLKQESRSRTLPASDPRTNQERMLEDMDREESDRDVATHDPKPERIAYADHLHPVYKLNIALRALQVLGQVLRNFPGSIEGDLKTRIASSCYRLGLRSLQSVLGAIERCHPGLSEYLGRLASDRKRLDRQGCEIEPLPKSAEQFTLWLAEACSLGVVKRVSQAVGHQQLGPTYRDVLQNVPDHASYALIDVSIKLDHLRGDGPPTKRVKELAERFQGNPLAYTVLRDLVFNHLCLFWHEYDIKQRLAATVGIEVQSPKLLSTESKLLGKKSAKRRRRRR